MEITTVLVGGFGIIGMILFEIHKRLERIVELLEEEK